MEKFREAHGLVVPGRGTLATPSLALLAEHRRLFARDPRDSSHIDEPMIFAQTSRDSNGRFQVLGINDAGALHLAASVQRDAWLGTKTVQLQSPRWQVEHSMTVPDHNPPRFADLEKFKLETVAKLEAMARKRLLEVAQRAAPGQALSSHAAVKAYIEQQLEIGRALHPLVVGARPNPDLDLLVDVHRIRARRGDVTGPLVLAQKQEKHGHTTLSADFDDAGVARLSVLKEWSGSAPHWSHWARVSDLLDLGVTKPAALERKLQEKITDVSPEDLD